MILALGPHKIHYERYGNGPQLLCCLSGYGETGNSYEGLALELADQYTVVCPDLPLHGHSYWEKPGFDLADLHSILQALTKQSGFEGQTTALAGYSMGGRIALAYAEHYPQFINTLILLAPDGLEQNFWYWMSTQTRAGNRLFKATMADPGWLFFAIKWAHKFKLLNDGMAKFSHRYLDDPLQRKNLFERWTLFRNFRPNLHRIKHIIARQPLPTLLVFGLYDSIIPPRLARRLSGNDDKHIKQLVISGGHRLLKPQFAVTIAAGINTLHPA